MSPQILELLFFAGIAFLIISKLMSILGNTNDDPNASERRTFFGANATIKDVTNSVKDLKKEESSVSDALIVISKKTAILKGLQNLKEVMPEFDIARFIKGATVACNMIIESLNTKDFNTLQTLVDSRYFETFKTLDYTSFVLQELEAKVSEIYMFGNTVFVKVYFKDAGSKFFESWTFSKSTIKSSPDWYLCNIEHE